MHQSRRIESKRTNVSALHDEDQILGWKIAPGEINRFEMNACARDDGAINQGRAEVCVLSVREARIPVANTGLRLMDRKQNASLCVRCRQAGVVSGWEIAVKRAEIADTLVCTRDAAASREMGLTVCPRAARWLAPQNVNKNHLARLMNASKKPRVPRVHAETLFGII